MQTELTGPDLKQGISIDELADGAMLGGHADGEAVLLVRRGGDIHAIGGTCTHYGGPLAEGLLVGDTVRCPWHHACFDLRTGEALRGSACSFERASSRASSVAFGSRMIEKSCLRLSAYFFTVARRFASRLMTASLAITPSQS